MPSFRSALAPLALGTLLLATGCAGKKDGTQSPKAKDKAQLESEKKEAVKAAEVNQLIENANANLRSGRYVSARKLAEDALAENPQNADAYAVLGQAAWRAGDFDASTEALRKAVELAPKNYGAGVALARNLRAAAKLDEALSVLEPIVAAEADDFQGKSCEELVDCEEVGGWCDMSEKVCKPPVGLESRMEQLWTHYLALDTEAGPKIADLLFLSGAAGAGEEGAEEAANLTNKAIRGYADFLRAFAGKGELVTIEGESGTSDLTLDASTSLLHSFGAVAGQPTRVVFSPLQIESRIDAGLAKQLGLESLGEVELLHGTYGVTLIPEVEFKGLKIKNVPALISDNSIFAATMPETPGVILGHQALVKIGSIVADIPTQSMTITKGPPATISSDAAELPLVLFDEWAIHVPATRVGIDGSDHKFWAWFGYYNVSAITLTHKAYLKSGHLPRELENPEDVEGGRKMVFIDQVDFGGVSIPGVGGLVYLEQPGEPGMTTLREAASFELGGEVNTPLLGKLKVTYAYGQGRIWVEAPAPTP